MKKDLKILILVCSLYLHVVQVAPIGDATVSDQEERNSFTEPKNAEEREQLLDRYKNMNNKQRNLLKKEDMNIVDDAQRVQSYKDGDKAKRDEHRSFLHVFKVGKGFFDNFGDRWRENSAARKAQDEIKQRQEEIKKRDPASMREDFIKKLKPYEIEALLPEQIAQIPVYKINAFSSEQFELFNNEQVQVLTVNQIGKLDANKIPALENRLTDKQIEYLNEEQIGEVSSFRLYRLNDDQLVALAKKIKNDLIPKNLSKIFNERFSNTNKINSSSVKYLTLTNDIIGKLVRSSNIAFITKDQVDEFLKTTNYKDLNSESKKAMLVILEQAFKGRSVPESINVELNKLKRAELTKEKARAKAEAEARARSERENAEARDKAKAKARAEQKKAEADARAKKAESESQGRATYNGQQELKKYFKKEDYEKLNTALEALNFDGNALDEQAWKKFYRAQASVFHPDKSMADPDKMKQLNVVNDYLKEFYQKV
jgi:hypothetical protein